MSKRRPMLARSSMEQEIIFLDGKSTKPQQKAVANRIAMSSLGAKGSGGILHNADCLHPAVAKHHPLWPVTLSTTVEIGSSRVHGKRAAALAANATLGRLGARQHYQMLRQIPWATMWWLLLETTVVVQEPTSLLKVQALVMGVPMLGKVA